MRPTLLLLAALLFPIAGCDSDDAGGIDLSALASVFGCSAITEVAVPSTTNGSLSTSDCAYLDNDGSYADYYAFRVTGTTNVTITQTSSALDSFLSLYSASGAELEFDDDSAGGSNARIARSLSAGTYVVAANSLGVETGSYTLTIARN